MEMMTTNFGDILRKLGWEDGFQIPIANDENKALEDELARLAMKKTKAKNALDNVSGRFEALKEHFKYVGQENEQNQKLITAHRQQVETMENEYHTSKSEKENTQISIKKIEKQLKEVDERTAMKKNELQKSVTRADQLKAEMDWDAEALKAWEESLKKRDDDTELIKKFTKEDERRYNELEAKRQHLQSEFASKRGRIAKIAAETNNYELIIERSGKVIKQLIAEREALIRQWKNTVKMLQQRDNDIVAVQNRIADIMEMLVKQRETLAEENTFLANQRRNNHELELEIENVNIVNSRMKRDFNALEQALLLIIGQQQSLKRQVAASAQHLENVRIDSKCLTQTLNEREHQTKLHKGQMKNLQDKLDEIQNTTLSSEERIRRIEKLIDTEEKLYNIFIADTEKVNALLFRTDQQLKEYKTVGKGLEVEISNTTFNCNQLRKHIHAGKKELEKIKEVVYDMEYRIDELEKRLYSYQDDKQTDAQTNEAERKIQELEQTLADHKEVQHALQNQVDRLQDDMRRLSNLIAADTEQYEVLKNKCENFQLIYEIGKKQIAAAKHSTQEKQVEENMMRLRIDQIEKEKKREEKQIFTLEKLRLNLDQAMKERQLEINTKKTIIQSKCRHLEDDRGRLRADIALRRLKIEQIQKKYHIALNSLGKNEDGEPLSVTHFKIKYAQDKFILQQEGDELDQKIKMAEKEIVAMENTLKLVNLTNSSFKNSLTPVKQEDKEVTELKMLVSQCRELDKVLKEHKNQVGIKDTEREELQSELDTAELEVKRCQDVVSNLEEEIDVIKKQELDKAKMLKRADCAIQRALKKIVNVDISKYIRDFEIRQLQDANNQVLQKLLEMSTLYREMTPLINKYVMEYGLRLPKKRKAPSTSSSLSTLSNCSSSRVVSVSTYELSSSGTVNTVNLSLQI